MRFIPDKLSDFFATREGRLTVAGTAVFALLATAQCSNSGDVASPITEINDGLSASLYWGGAVGLQDVSATVNSGLNESLLENPQVLSVLISARSVATQAPRVGTVDVSDLYVGCPSGGTASFAGELAYGVDERRLDVYGTYTQTLAGCQANSTVTASDGECEITTAFTGGFSVDYAFDYEYGTGAYLIASSFATASPIELVQNGVEHELSFDLFYMEETDAAGSLTGTVTVDGTQYDLSSLDVDTRRFTRAELGCD